MSFIDLSFLDGLATLITQIFAVVFIADLIVGFVHWLEDNYGQEHWPIIGKNVIAPNLLHHSKPKDFCKNTWWQSADYQVVASLFVIAAASLMGLLTWQLIAVLALACNGNEVHKWSHRSKKENGKIITWLQDQGLIQSRRQHGQHHGGERNSHYCTLTEWVNPILERIKLWRALEWCIKKVTGVSPRVDPDVIARRQRNALSNQTTRLMPVTV